MTKRAGIINGYPYRRAADGKITVETATGPRLFDDFEACEAATAEWLRATPALPPQTPATTNQPAAKISRNAVAACTLAMAGGIAWLAWPQSGFTDDEIADVKASIRAEWAKKKGTTVEDVAMMRERDETKLTGFVRLRFDGIKEPLTKACTASRGEKQYIWQCR